MSTDTAALIAEIKSLPKLPTVRAKSMLVAQTIKWSAEDQAAFAAHRAFNAKHGFPQRVSVPVVRADDVRIGELVL